VRAGRNRCDAGAEDARAALSGNTERAMRSDLAIYRAWRDSACPAAKANAGRSRPTG